MGREEATYFVRSAFMSSAAGGYSIDARSGSEPPQPQPWSAAAPHLGGLAADGTGTGMVSCSRPCRGRRTPRQSFRSRPRPLPAPLALGPRPTEVPLAAELRPAAGGARARARGRRSSRATGGGGPARVRAMAGGGPARVCAMAVGGPERGHKRLGGYGVAHLEGAAQDSVLRLG